MEKNTVTCCQRVAASQIHCGFEFFLCTFYFLISPEHTTFKQTIILGNYSCPLIPCTEFPDFFCLVLTCDDQELVQGNLLWKTVPPYPFIPFGGNPSCLCGQSPAHHPKVVPCVVEFHLWFPRRWFPNLFFFPITLVSKQCQHLLRHGCFAFFFLLLFF